MESGHQEINTGILMLLLEHVWDRKGAEGSDEICLHTRRRLERKAARSVQQEVCSKLTGATHDKEIIILCSS